MSCHYKPRDYQVEAVDRVFEELANVRSTLMVMATGVGKTWCYLKVAERFLAENQSRVLVIAHREELITQPAQRWRADQEEWPAIEMGVLRSEISDDCDMFDSAPMNDRLVIASIPTLNSGKRCKNCTADCQECNGTGKKTTPCGCEDGCGDCKGSGESKAKCKVCSGDGWICIEDDCRDCFEHFVRRMMKFPPQDFGLIVCDEAHHSPASTYTRIFRYFRQNQAVKIVGTTATPDRSDEEEMGQVYESVAYEYNLPQPILDGWLTPIEQQFITVEGLNLTNIRTTAGDLNKGDLEHEMLAEKALHGVTTPLVEIACGLPEGTIDGLINENRLHDLPELCTKRESVLIHAVDVAHAERMTEIINRYFPESALCIIGTTQKHIRRDGLKRFGEGGYQFLLSCGVFLEGTDLPNVSIIGMARPTKSRALYSQMLGRGVRPLSGLVDGVADPEERCRLIRESSKPCCTVIDFVGNSGRHKLVCAIDVLGDSEPDELVNGIIRKAAKLGQPVDILKAISQAKQEAQDARQKQAREDAAARLAAQEEAAKRSAERRRGIVAGASYSRQTINPFDVFDMSPQREPGYHKGRKPSEAMRETLKKAGVPFNDETSWWEAHCLIETIFDRRRKGLASYKQTKWLTDHGYSSETSFDDCRKIMDAWAKNNWKKPASIDGVGKPKPENDFGEWL